MKTIYKINHWILFFSFLGLVTTSLAAEFFFSKQAIMQSFEFSLGNLGIMISPVDQLFIARIERRNTWDYHFYVGIVFFISLAISIIRTKDISTSRILKESIRFMYISGLVLFASGLIMYFRLYFILEDSYFSLLKTIHNFAKWSFIVFVITHIATIIKLENTSRKGIISNMFRATVIAAMLILSFNGINANADEVNRDKWLLDENYTKGMMYLKGSAGVQTILKEIANCPYEKCRKSDVTNDDVLRTVTIEIKKPDYKEAVKLLNTSAMNGNFLAADKLVDFLITRVDYKNSIPDSYILELLDRDLGINYEQYKTMLLNAFKVGSSSKGCSSSYLYAESYEKGYLGLNKDNKRAKELYSIASDNCPSENFYSILAKSKKN